MTTKDYNLAPTQFGFRWGPLEVVRMTDDPKYGVFLEVFTKHRKIILRASPNGQVLEVDNEHWGSTNHED